MCMRCPSSRLLRAAGPCSLCLAAVLERSAVGTPTLSSGGCCATPRWAATLNALRCVGCPVGVPTMGIVVGSALMGPEWALKEETEPQRGNRTLRVGSMTVGWCWCRSACSNCGFAAVAPSRNVPKQLHGGAKRQLHGGTVRRCMVEL
eukprot:366453-Chlamydomonas_euryale.AAC.13